MRVKINERFKYIHEDGRSVLRDKLTGTSTNVTYRPEIQAMAYALDVANRDRADAIKQSEQRAKERADMARELSEYKAKAESGRVSIERQAKRIGELEKQAAEHRQRHASKFSAKECAARQERLERRTLVRAASLMARECIVPETRFFKDPIGAPKASTLKRAADLLRREGCLNEANELERMSEQFMSEYRAFMEGQQ